MLGLVGERDARPWGTSSTGRFGRRHGWQERDGPEPWFHGFQSDQYPEHERIVRSLVGVISSSSLPARRGSSFVEGEWRVTP